MAFQLYEPFEVFLFTLYQNIMFYYYIYNFGVYEMGSSAYQFIWLGICD